ncbi:MAG TPA: c-type cytochrome [Burkholderiales bacterium]
MRRLGIVLQVASVSAALALLGPAVSLAADAPAAKRAIKPDLIYHNYCSVCHGDRGDGRSRARGSLVPPPKDFTAPGLREQLPRDWMVRVVRDGKPGTAMVGWKTQLDEREIEAVVDYVRDAFMSRQPGAPAPDVSGTSAHGGRGRDPSAATAPQGMRADMSLPLPNGLAGDRARGKRFYDANCATCHGVKGDAQGPRAYFINPKPRNFLDASSRAQLNRPALYAAIYAGRRGTEMPAWRTVIDDQTMADVAEYVFTAFVRPAK